MPDVLASQVAAGEVIERPASVVKELVENALDAGAGEVAVEIRRGGVSLVRVADDGCGMSAEDAVRAFGRHATSKLRTSEDLQAIRTLGFRGEALPSIASVAGVRMTTREAGALAGTEVEVAAGVVKQVREAGCAPGTRLEVRQLFANVPARRKFLRSEATESGHVEWQVRQHALAVPGVRFRYLQDERVVFDLPAVGEARARIAHLHGAAVAGGLIAFEGARAGAFRFHGFVMAAADARRGRKHQFVFLNGRPVEDGVIARGLRDGFRGALPDAFHPAAWLWIEMEPALVDVNVHPAKREVRFRRPDELRAALTDAVLAALRPKAAPSVPRETSVPREEPAVPVFPAARPRQTELPEPVAAEPARGSLAGRAGLPAAGGAEPPSPGGPPRFRPLAVLHRRYVLLESADGLVLLDPAAARERIVYEAMRATAGDRVEAQRLLVPVLVELDPRHGDLVRVNLRVLAEAGVEIRPFGGRTVQVATLPACITVTDPQRLVDELVHDLAEGTRGAFAPEIIAKALARRAGSQETAALDRVNRLLAELLACELPYCAPDGRPTLSEVSLAEIERRFRV